MASTAAAAAASGVWNLTRRLRWPLIAAGTAVATGVAVYGRQASQFAQHVKDARAGSNHGRLASRAAEQSVDAAQAQLQAGLLRHWKGPALWMAGLSNESELRELARRVYYRCAVLNLHGKTGMALLEKAVTMRSALSRKAASDAPSRTTTPQGYIESWGSVSYARQQCVAMLQEEVEERPSRLFTVRALNNVGWLWYATGHDDDAIEQFRQCSARSDELSGADAGLVGSMAASATVREALAKLGAGQQPTSPLPLEVKQLLQKAQRAVVNGGHLPVGPSTSDDQYQGVVADIQQLWRKRITARLNLMQVLITTDKPMPKDVYRVLLQLCRGEGAGRLHLAPPLQVPYTHLDRHWLSGGGMTRIVTGVAAALTDLLWCEAVPAPYTAAVLELAGRAFDLAREQAQYTSATRQGMLQYHYAKYLYLQPDAASLERAAWQVAQAAVNHHAAAGDSSIHRDVRLEAEAELLRMAMGHPPSHEPAAILHRLTVQHDASAAQRLRDFSRSDADHPVVVRAMMARCAAAVVPGVVRKWATIRGCSHWTMSEEETIQLCDAVEGLLRLMVATASTPASTRPV